MTDMSKVRHIGIDANNRLKEQSTMTVMAKNWGLIRMTSSENQGPRTGDR
jgi:hypothetical protein